LLQAASWKLLDTPSYISKLYSRTLSLSCDLETPRRVQQMHGFNPREVLAGFMFDRKVKIKVTVKVKLSLCLTKHHAMKACWGSGGIAPHILDLCTRWR
jgi:hypothetical protein